MNIRHAWRQLRGAPGFTTVAVLTLALGISLIRLNSVELGFQTERVLTLNVALPDSRYPTPPARLAFFQQLTERIRLVPGVQTVAFANQFPLRGGWGGSFILDGPSGAVRDDADFQAVGADYFATLGIPLIRGRLLSAGDRLGTAPVAVVSATFVNRFVRDRDPIGVQFRRTPSSPLVSIVGVVGELRRDGKAAKLWPQVYLSAAQTDLYPVRLGSIGVRAAVEPLTLVTAIERAVWAIDPDQPIAGVRTLDQVLSASMALRRFQLVLLLIFAGLAVVLALLGVYGVVAYAAVQRTREIGIRVALGASRGDVIGLIVRGSLSWVVAGVAIGVAASAGVTRIMRTMLFGVEPTDPLTFGAVAIAMISIALAASYIPAITATSLVAISISISVRSIGDLMPSSGW